MKYLALSILSISVIALNSFAIAVTLAQPVTAAPSTVTSAAQPVVAPSVWSLPTYRDYKNELKAKKLAAQGFKIEAGLLYDIKATPLEPVLLGKLKVIETKYVFQWADKEFHDAYLAAGGIPKDFLKEVLADPGQAAGKGFYVSFDPADSSSYGDSLTVFQPKGPIVALEYIQAISQLVNSDTAFVQRLSDAGVHGLRSEGYSPTWISMINAEALQKAQNLSAELFHLFAKDQKYKGIIANYAYPDIFESYVTPDDVAPITYKIIKHLDLSIDDFSQLSTIGQVSSGPIVEVIAKSFYKLFEQATTAADKAKLLVGIQGMYLQAKGLIQFQKSIATPTTNETQSKYQEILNVFDLATIVQKKKSKYLVSALSKYSHDYQIRKDKAAAALIANPNMDMLEYIKIVKGSSVAYRDSDISETRKFGNLKYLVDMNGFVDLVNVASDNQTLAPSAPVTTKLTYTNWERLRLLESTMPNFSKELEDYYATTPIDPSTPLAKATLSHGLKELVSRLNGADLPLSVSLAATPTRPAAYVYAGGPVAKFSTLVSAHPFNRNDKSTLLPLSDLFAKKDVYLMGAPKLNHPFNELVLIPYNADKYNLVGTVLNRWVVDAKTDAEFLSRSRESMQLFLQANPEVGTAFPEIIPAP